MNGTLTPSPAKLQPALLGGAFIGVLSSLPFLSYLNGCCCLWVVVGGLVAAWVMQQNHPYAISTADGVLVGLLAGVFGALIGLVVQVVLSPVQRHLDVYMFDALGRMMGQVPPMVEEVIEQRRSGPAITLLGAVGSLVMMIIIWPIFAMLGGLLGAALFRKTTNPPTVLPPVYPTDLPPAP
jgi:hypothetical protein